MKISVVKELIGRGELKSGDAVTIRSTRIKRVIGEGVFKTGVKYRTYQISDDSCSTCTCRVTSVYDDVQPYEERIALLEKQNKSIIEGYIACNVKDPSNIQIDEIRIFVRRVYKNKE